MVERLPRIVVKVAVGEHVAEDSVARLEDRAEVRPAVEDGVGRHGTADGRDLRIGEEETTALGRLGRVRRRLNIEHDKLDGLGDVGEGRERGAPVRLGRDVGERERERVDQVDLVPDTVADGELGNVGQRAGDLGGHADEVVLADRDNLDRVRLFLVRRRILNVERDELLGRLCSVGKRSKALSDSDSVISR